MPSLDPAEDQDNVDAPLTQLPFPPITKRHILNCSYEDWYNKYRTSTLRSRIIPLTSAFLEYLREDGLWLPDDTPYEETEWSSANASKLTDPDFENSARPNDASRFQDVHTTIQETIKELGGSVVPKLNWSAPKDALHMALSKNSLECKSANDIYLLLKSSIFVTHDLEHAFDDTADSASSLTKDDIKYTLVLRPYFKINTAFEFRCFVQDRRIVGISQRELKHLDYSPELLEKLQEKIEEFFEEKLRHTFEDPNFVFDVYLPEPHDRVRLIDINPWAPRTDPLLFSWMELLTMEMPKPRLGFADSSAVQDIPAASSGDEIDDGGEVEELPFKVEFRTVQKDDPEAYNFGCAPYSAHKLPREVVDASVEGGSAMRELMQRWERLQRGETDRLEDSTDEEDETNS